MGFKTALSRQRLDRIEGSDANGFTVVKSVGNTTPTTQGSQNKLPTRHGVPPQAEEQQEITMQMPRAVGRDAASRKYDILSALMAFALGEDKTIQRQVLRAMALVTTRYNWQRDELSMGQAEIARLWSVDERTVKREMARLRSQGWFVLKRQGARGRVSVYGIDFDRMLDDTRPAWERIGSDFVARMNPAAAQAEPSNVIPLRKVPQPNGGGTAWATAQRILHGENEALYGSWLHMLTEAEITDGCLVLIAPTRFHATYVNTHLKDRLRRALRLADPALSDVVVQV